MASGSLLSIGLSGLNAAQAGLTTTGHNIANVNTAGFSRQQVIQGTQQPMYTGAGYFGQGTDIETVRRMYNEFLAAQTQQTTASATALDTMRTQLKQIDSLLSDPAAGLAPALDGFFGGINGVAGAPGDVASRQVMLSDAQVLVGRFQQLAGSMSNQQASANAQVAEAVGTINAYASQIASLNRRIAELTAASNGLQQPNDLLDQRDELVLNLNKLVGVSTVPQSDGMLNVYLSSGSALVVGMSANALTTVPDSGNPVNVQIGMKTTSGKVVPLASRDLSGGSIGGLLEFRDTTLAQAQNSLGQIASVLAQTFNDQHALGIDLSGAPGGAFFTAPVPRVQPALTNTGNATVAAALVPGGASALTASDYRVAYDGANYTVTRLSDNKAFPAGALPQTVDGLQITVSGGAATAGDSFLVQPTTYAVSQFGVAITDPRKIAAAAPVSTSLPATNTGSGRISAGSVGSAYLASPLPPPPAKVTLQYATAGNQLTGFPATQSVTVTLNGTSNTYAAGAPVPYQSGATITFGGISVVISGAPGNNDAFVVAPNTSPAGDNRNALALAALQSANLVGGTASYGGAYGQLVGLVGATTGQVMVEAAAQDAMLIQARKAEQEVSGVNLDEEAANMQRYQQAYQASAKIMTVATVLFDSILAIGR